MKFEIGGGFLATLTIIFVIAKIGGYIDWSWWIVFLPILIGFGITLLILWLQFFLLIINRRQPRRRSSGMIQDGKKMEKDCFKELYEAKKELLRCYNWMLEVQEKLICFPQDEILQSKKEILDNIKVMEVDLENEKEVQE